ncbi:hypothetical protein [Streptomyces sp. NPDC090994]|uniref:hypothetical protein n=1 Tax=Streptomyces sp. NPDC090994 TaxID=3365969 RepID=UPI0038045B91
MQKVILMCGPVHGRVLHTDVLDGEVLREAGWSYWLTDDLDEKGRRITQACRD